ncbi:MAG: hypothetical protein Q8N91_06810 [Candidatus Omnitrophota bacterium]|nr:hypothetical protein [Candidatus Omnitrophota bacterium]
MDVLYSMLKFFHVMSFVFMSVPLFNLIVVNERALLGSSFNYHADRYMENIITHGAYRCFVFQSAAFITGVLLLVFGPLGLEALWTNWVILVKTILLFSLMGLLSYVHFFVQPKIESIMAGLRPDSPTPEALMNEIKPYRAKRKKLATFCLFLVVTTIILGLQVYGTFHPILNIALIALAGLFALRANKTLVRFGWL